MGTTAQKPVPGCTTACVELAVVGCFDRTVVPQADTVLHRVAALRLRHLVIDMTACVFIDAAAIDWLLGAQRQLRQAGGQLTVHAPTAQARHGLRVAGASEVLTVTPSFEVGKDSCDERVEGAQSPLA